MLFSGKSLLPQYLGMYRLTVDNVETYMVVMRNIFSNHLKIHRKYDLKGSKVDREASEKVRGGSQSVAKSDCKKSYIPCKKKLEIKSK